MLFTFMKRNDYFLPRPPTKYSCIEEEINAIKNITINK